MEINTPEQHCALARDRAQLTDALGGPKCPTEQPKAVQLLQPLAVQH